MQMDHFQKHAKKYIIFKIMQRDNVQNYANR